MIQKLKAYTSEGVSNLTVEINGDADVPKLIVECVTQLHCEKILETFHGVERISFELDNKEYSIEPNKKWEIKEL